MSKVEVIKSDYNEGNTMLAVRAYKCKHCGKVVYRESNKQWIKSYCDETGKIVRLRFVVIEY